MVLIEPNKPKRALMNIEPKPTMPAFNLTEEGALMLIWDALRAMANDGPRYIRVGGQSMRLPNAMDGVPNVNFPGIRPGETFTYRYPVRQSGTYWYHSHSRLQEQLGHYGPLVIDPAGAEPYQYGGGGLCRLTARGVGSA